MVLNKKLKIKMPIEKQMTLCKVSFYRIQTLKIFQFIEGAVKRDQ
jgi:hypothetical protein